MSHREKHHAGGHRAANAPWRARKPDTRCAVCGQAICEHTDHQYQGEQDQAGIPGRAGASVGPAIPGSNQGSGPIRFDPNRGGADPSALSSPERGRGVGEAGRGPARPPATLCIHMLRRRRRKRGQAAAGAGSAA